MLFEHLKLDNIFDKQILDKNHKIEQHNTKINNTRQTIMVFEYFWVLYDFWWTKYYLVF